MNHLQLAYKFSNKIFINFVFAYRGHDASYTHTNTNICMRLNNELLILEGKKNPLHATDSKPTQYKNLNITQNR